MALKERALARTTLHGAPTGRYHPPDNLIEFLNNLRPTAAGTRYVWTA
jgi:hypothetical protein